MISEQIVGWFSLGFLVGAAVVYGAAMAQAYWVKAKALLMMKESNAKLSESTKMLKESCQIKSALNEALNVQLGMAREYSALQEKYLASLEDYKTLGGEVLEDRKEYGELLRKYEELVKDHKALLGHTGGGIEGTA